jgi:hypothetical protein
VFPSRPSLVTSVAVTTNPAHKPRKPQEALHLRQIQDMQAEFAAMLRDTLEKLQQRLEERHTRPGA